MASPNNDNVAVKEKEEETVEGGGIMTTTTTEAATSSNVEAELRAHIAEQEVRFQQQEARFASMEQLLGKLLIQLQQRGNEEETQSLLASTTTTTTWNPRPSQLAAASLGSLYPTNNNLAAEERQLLLGGSDRDVKEEEAPATAGGSEVEEENASAPQSDRSMLLIKGGGGGGGGGGANNSNSEAPEKTDSDDGDDGGFANALGDVTKSSMDLAHLQRIPTKQQEETAPGAGGGTTRGIRIVPHHWAQHARQSMSRLLFMGGGDDDDDEAGECLLTEDVYSLMYIAPFNSATFLFSAGVFFFQMTLMCLVTADQLDPESDNPLGIPASVPYPVLAAQALCMLLAVAVQQDLIQAVTVFHAGHCEDLTRELPAATYCKFVLANGLQSLVGFMQLINTFILIMQSGTVIDVFMNFAGLEFISLIDDVGFMLGQSGFITLTVQAYCEKSQEVKQPIVQNLMFRRVCYCIAWFGLMFGYVWIVLQQQRGRWLCSKIFVQWGDEFRPEYSGFSGNYVKQPGFLDQRVWYLEAKSIGKRQHSVLAYCREEEAWTHSIWNPRQSALPNPCDWNAKSPGTTLTYDILETSDWEVFSVLTHTTYPMTVAYMTCNDCTGGERGTCNELHGTCIDNECVCHDNRYGLNCVFEAPCPTLQLDERQEPFPDFLGGGNQFSDTFHLLLDSNNEMVLVYDHPVYVYDYQSTNVDYLLFTGRRWILTDRSWLGLLDTTEKADNFSAMIDTLRNDFHAVFYDYTFGSASEAMDVGTPSYTGEPIGLSWYGVNNVDPGLNRTLFEELGTAADTTFLCAVCDEDNNPCTHAHHCNETGHCNCREGYIGALCEVAMPCDNEDYNCSNSGVCDLKSGECTCSQLYPDLFPANRYFGSFCELDKWGHLVDDDDWHKDSQSWHNRTHECGCTNLYQLEYRGDIDWTTDADGSNVTCQVWHEMEPNTHMYTADNFPYDGLENGTNACRNPEFIRAGPWCFTGDPDATWSWNNCDIPACPEEICPELDSLCGCRYKKQEDYRGTINTTISGLPCQRWDERQSEADAIDSSLLPKSDVTPANYPNASLEENYCRNPGGMEEGAWCFTNDPDIPWEPCHVPVCSYKLCPGDPREGR